MDTGSLSLWGLFVSAFVSSTLFPGGSEVVLGLLDGSAQHNPLVLLLVASSGNTLGGMSSWLIGRVLPAKNAEQARFAQAVVRLRRYGSPVLLLSWLPVVGDPLCVAAGWLRIHWGLALGFIAIGKTVRYAVILWIV